MNKLPIKVEGIIFRKTDSGVELLLLKRSPEDGGFWQPLTGTLEFGESLKNCLVRELMEETGISHILDISEEIYRFNWEKNNFYIVELVYLIQVDRSANVVLSNEHKDFIWCNFSEAFTMLGQENNKNALCAAKKFLKVSLPEVDIR